MMKNKFLFGLIFFFLLVVTISGALAVKPASVISFNTETLQIYTAGFEYYPVGQSFDLDFHVYNSSGYILDNTSVSCEFHLYNKIGEHLIQNMLSYNPSSGDFEQFINSSLIPIGKYNYLVNCNNTQAGAFSGYFIVNSSGFQDIFTGWFFFVFALLLVGVTFAFGYLSYLLRNVSKSQNELYGLKSFVFLLFFVNIFFCGVFPFAVIYSLNDLFSFLPIVITYFSINVLVFITFIWIYGFGLLKNTLNLFFKRGDKRG